MNIYVGNLNFRAEEDQVRALFENFGAVESVKLLSDRETGRPRGFGFVVMNSDDEAEAAIRELDKYDFQGRPMVVNQARERTSRW